MDKKSNLFLLGMLLSFLLLIVLAALSFLWEVPISSLAFKIVITGILIFFIAGIISILFNN